MIYTVLISLLSAIFYRLGGVGGGKHWYFDTKMRDLGVPLIKTITLMLLLNIKAIWWIHLLSFGIAFGAMTTYCKFGKQEDVHWYNWLCTGLFYGFSMIPYAVVGAVSWWAFGIQMGFLGISIMAWSEAISKDWLEEGGRGFLFNISSLIVG